MRNCLTDNGDGVYGRDRWRMKTVAKILALALILIPLCGCSLLRSAAFGAKYVSWRVFTSDGRLAGRLGKAAVAANEGRGAESERRYRKSRERRPDSPDAAFGHAAALAGLGRKDEALTAVERAADLGFDQTWRLLALAPLRGDDRFIAARERIVANHGAARARLFAADSQLSASDAPSFRSVTELNSWFDRQAWRAYGLVFKRSDEWELQSRQLRMRRIAALDRYAKDHPSVPDLRAADLARFHALVDRVGWEIPWRAELAHDVERAAAEYRRTWPQDEALREVRFFEILARGFRAAEDREPGLVSFPPAEGCASILDDLAQFAAATPEDAWTGPAAAARTVCVHVAHPADVESFRAARALSRSRSESGSETVLFHSLYRLMTVASLSVEGPPDFKVTAHNGNEVTLASLRGRVVLLNFWSPG